MLAYLQLPVLLRLLHVGFYFCFKPCVYSVKDIAKIYILPPLKTVFHIYFHFAMQQCWCYTVYWNIGVIRTRLDEMNLVLIMICTNPASQKTRKACV